MDAALALADYNLGEADIAGYFKGINQLSKQINIILNNLVRNVVKYFNYVFVRFDVQAAAAVHAARAPLRPAPADLLLPALHLQVTQCPLLLRL